MSVTPAPTNIGTPLYNPVNYVNSTTGGSVTIDYLNANFLKFPSAQGTEEFPNGLFSVGAVDFNSSNGVDRTITGISNQSFTDILGNTLYTSYIEENSTAIGTYNGGLIIHSSDTIDLQGGNVLVNGNPITTGTAGNVNNNQDNTFQNGFTQTFNGAISIDNTQSNIGQLTNNNTAIGYWAGLNQTSGSNNVAIGYNSGVDVTTPTISNTIAIGSNVTTTNPLDIVLGTASNTFVKFSNSGNGYQLSTDLSGNPNFTIASLNAIVLQATGVNILSALNGTQIQGGSLQVQNVVSYPNTNTGYSNYASVNTLPYFYNGSTWSQLAIAPPITTFTITSSNTSTNSWNFTIPNTYGNGYTYTLYTTGSPVVSNTGGGTQPNWSAGAINIPNNSIFFANGNGIYQPYTSTSGIFVDYCSGSANNHTATASGGGYVMNVISFMGSTSATWTISSNSVSITSTISGNLPCPAQANGNFTTNYTITFGTSLLTTCSAVLTGNIVIPS